MFRKILFLIVLLCSDHVYGLQLKKVLVLSRHSLRTPLSSELARMTSKEWPNWNATVGYLTPKGALLESFMGKYFGEWLKKEGLLTDPCPEEKSVHIYANTRQRTRATAIAFTEGAFQNCNVKVNFKNITQMDPIFDPVVHDTTELFKQLAKQEMLEKLAKSDLRDVYLALNDITDIQNSAICKEDGYCDLSKDKEGVIFEAGLEPNVTGPFFISNAMVDSFLMSYYEGMPLQDIGWGEIKNDEHWKLLTKIVKENLNVRFNLTTAAKDLSKPLLHYVKENLDRDTKFTLIVGHNSNLSPFLTCMEFKPFVLPEQFELTPIGGKLVFQKWTDGVKDFLKVEFVYQSSEQLRNAEVLSLENPPKKITMYLKHCVPDDAGYCPWGDFEKILKDLLL